MSERPPINEARSVFAQGNKMSVLAKFERRAALMAQLEVETRAKQQQPANVLTRMMMSSHEVQSINKAVGQDALGALPKNRLEQKIRQANTGEITHASQFAEVNRIIDLPVIQDMTKEEIEVFNRQHVLAEAYEAGFRFFDCQIYAIIAYLTTNGGCHPIGVGWGKTLTTLMVAQAAMDKGLKKIVLLIPPEVLAQFINDVKTIRRWIKFVCPLHYIGGRNREQRRLIAQSNKPGIYVITYSMLSTKDTSEILEAIAPQLIIPDEAHKLGRRNSARTKRILHYVDHHPGTELCCLSGTLTSKTIKDYYHLIQRSLRKWNPLPNVEAIANEWATMIDSQASTTNQAGPLLPLVAWAQHNFPDQVIEESLPGFREAYRLRLNSSPGVVSSGAADIGTSLILSNRVVTNFKDVEGWTRLDQLMTAVNEEWITPNGDEIEHAIHSWKWLNELTAGFYNELVWPEPDILSARRNIALETAVLLLDKAKIHHAAGQEYAKALRKFLESRSKPGLDTPLLVGSHMAQHGDRDVDSELFLLWQTMKSLEFEGMPERDSNAVRICPYKIHHAVEWACRLPKIGGVRHGGIIWYHHRDIGLWLKETLIAAGIPVLHCPAGKQYNSLICDITNAHQLVLASITAHGTGKNLQHFSHQYFMQWPRAANIAEQTLGRTHRNGQKADELIVVTNATLIFDDMNKAACINDSLYVHQTTGNRQKLIYATYDPLPKIFPPEVLRERGLQNKILNSSQRAMMYDKFGKVA